MFVYRRGVDRKHELENFRRSLAMLAAGVKALTREQALGLVEELAGVQAELDRRRAGLQSLLAYDCTNASPQVRPDTR